MSLLFICILTRIMFMCFYSQTQWNSCMGNFYQQFLLLCISQAGHLLIVNEALYCLRLSGKAFNQSFINILCPIGFKSFKTKPSIYLHSCPDPDRNIYECTISCVDGLCCYVADLKGSSRI